MERTEQIISYSIDTCSSIISNTIVKCIGALGFVLSRLAFGNVKEEILLSIGILIVLDTITAIISTRKTGEPISSRKFLNSVTKMFIYAVMIAGASLAENVIGLEVFITEIMTGFLAITELISILENVGRAGYVVPQKLLNTLEELKESK